jgi:hypothetical protein
MSRVKLDKSGIKISDIIPHLIGLSFVLAAVTLIGVLTKDKKPKKGKKRKKKFKKSKPKRSD